MSKETLKEHYQIGTSVKDTEVPRLGSGTIIKVTTKTVQVKYETMKVVYFHIKLPEFFDQIVKS